MRVRSHNTNEEEHGCRCCRHARENVQHFATCDVVGKIFLSFAELSGLGQAYKDASVTVKERFALFAIPPTGPPLKEGLLNLHLLLWKYVIYGLVQVDVDDQKFETHQVWQATWHKLESCALAKQEQVRTDLLRADSRGVDPPNITRRAVCLEPLGTIAPETGLISWSDDHLEQIRKLATPPARPGKRKNKRTN